MFLVMLWHPAKAAKGSEATYKKVRLQKISGLGLFVSLTDHYLFVFQPSVRKTHCSGRKHKENVKDYYQKWMEEQAQSLIDKTSALQPLALVGYMAPFFLVPVSLSFFREAAHSE